MPSSSRQPTSAPAQTSDSLPTLIDFMYSIPSPVTTTLIYFSPYISSIRRTLEITSWRSHCTESWLSLAAWWVVCTFAYSGLKYFLPILLVSAIAFIRWKPPSFLRSSPLITEKNLQSTISDLITIHALIPPLLSPLLTAIPLRTLLRIALLTYPLYLLLTYFVPLHILIGVSGTILLTCRAPWIQTAMAILWDSAFIRWSFYRLYSHLTGYPLPPKTLSIQTHPITASTASDGITNSVRFLFMIYENQRWWAVGHWMASLLPTERPSWCTASRIPVCLPDALSLPEPAVSFLPVAHATGERAGTGQMIKRTARWSWEEDEWRVMVRKDGNGLVGRVERPLPNEKDSSGQTSGSARWSFNGVRKRRKSSDSAAWEKPEEDEDGLFEGDDDDDGLIVTDPDGWVYGDNKWQEASPKNGLSKFTRYRRWTRIAVLTETSEVVDASDYYGIAEANMDSFSTQSRVSTGLSLNSSTGSRYYEHGSAPPSPASSTRSRSRSRSRGRLTQRLRAVC